MEKGNDSAYERAVDLAENILDEVARATPEWGQVTAWATELAELARTLGPPPQTGTGPDPPR